MLNYLIPYSHSSSLLDDLGWLEHAFLPVDSNPPIGCILARQRHSAEIVMAMETLSTKRVEADGVIAIKKQPVAVYTADCLPILIADDRKHHVAAIHAGLKGTFGGILFNAVQGLIALGACVSSLYIAIGPSIGACCYELEQGVLEDIKNNPLLPQKPPYYRQQPFNQQSIRPQAKTTTQGIWFDLSAMAQQILHQMGIPLTQIDTFSICTYCMAELGSSYRRSTHLSTGYAMRYSWIKRCE